MAMYERRLGVIGIIPKMPGTQVTTKYTDAGLHWLFKGTASSSLARFWSEASGGLVDITKSGVFGWHVIEDTNVYNAINVSSRAASAQAACIATKELGIRVNDWDGWVFIIGGFPVN